MMFSVLLVGIVLFSACESRPGVHHFTTETITRIHKIKGGGQVIQYETHYGGNGGMEMVNGGADGVHWRVDGAPVINKHIKMDPLVNGGGQMIQYETQFGGNGGIDLNGGGNGGIELNGGGNGGIGLNGGSNGGIDYKVNGGAGGGKLRIKGSPVINKHIKVNSLVNGGNSYLNSNTGVNRRNICGRGIVDKTATGIRNAAHSGASDIAGAINDLTGNGTALGPVGGAVNAVGEGAKDIVQNAFDGADFAIQDAACGLGNIANAAAEALDNGDIMGGVGTIGKEFFGGLGNMAEDLASEAASGVGGAANKVFGFVGGLGK